MPELRPQSAPAPIFIAKLQSRSTGKERDTETGLDYFGARYYGSNMGRFTSPDPKNLALRHLLDPQKLNKYSYVLNNPLASFDPDGQEEVKVTIRAFIPDSRFRYMGATWYGDGRSFSKAPNASSRAQVTMTIETDPNKSSKPLVGQPRGSTSGSAVDAFGRTFTGRSDVQTSVDANRRDSSGNSIVTVTVSASDPLVPGAPAASGTFTVVVPSDAGSASANGTATAYPAWEGYAERSADGSQGTLFQYAPEPSANTPSTLLTGATVDVKGTTTMPDKKQCADKKDCK
jgi:RHS repeat-associated protein